MPVRILFVGHPKPSPTHEFMCPGCRRPHGFRDDLWSFNGDFIAPTIHPSILVQGVARCHSFVTDGQIRFLPDCDHDLAGQTVDIPFWE